MIAGFMLGQVQAASFDCAKAGTTLEKTICNNPQLNDADTQLGKVYSGLRKALSQADAKQLKKEQREWLKARTIACKADSVSCLLPVYAARVAVLQARLSALSVSKPAEQPRQTRFLPAETGRFGDVDYRWYIEPSSQVRYIQLQSGYSPDRLDKLNAVLRDRHLKLAEDTLTCLSSPNLGQSYQNVSTEVARADQDIVSVTSHIEFDCGGAHPDFYRQSIVLAVDSGRRLLLEDLYLLTGALPKGLDLVNRKPENLYYDYVDKRAEVVKQLAMAAAGNEADLEAGCDYSLGGSWEFIDDSWYLSAQGLAVQPEFPSVARACEMDFIIPYAVLAAYRNPDSPLPASGPAVQHAAQAGQPANLTQLQGALKRCDEGQFQGSYYECMQAIEQQQLAEYPNIAARNGTTLIVPTQTGIEQFVNGDPESGEFIGYIFLLYVSEIDQVLVYTQFYESGAYLMIDRQSGQSTELDALPLLSPDRRRLVTVSGDLMAGYGANRIQVYRASGMQLEWSFEPQDWEPQTGAWLSNDSLEVIKRVYDASFDQFKDLPLKVKYAEGGWRFADTVP